MLDRPCSEVVWRVLATHCIHQFPPSLPLQCVTVCHHISTAVHFLTDYKRTSPFKSARWGRQFSWLLAAEVCGISGSNAGYTMFRGSVKGTGYPLHSPVSPFTSPPVRHRVPSHFKWTLPVTRMRYISEAMPVSSRYHWPRDLKRDSTPARLLVLWVCVLCFVR